MMIIDMQHRSKSRSSQLRTTRAYLIAILALAFLLFSLSLVSLAYQQISVRELSASNLQLLGEGVASELENRVRNQISLILGPERLEAVSRELQRSSALERSRALRREFDAARIKFPLAKSFLVISGEDLVFPRISKPLSASSDPILPPGLDASLGRFHESWSYAEKLRLRRPQEALSLYLQAAEADVPAPFRALATLRAARLQRRLDRSTDSADLFRRLLRDYGDVYGENEAPYALTLPLELGELKERVYPDYRQEIRRVYDNLLGGRWDLDYFQVDFYAAALERELGIRPSDRPATNFLEEFKTASLLRDRIALPRNGPLDPTRPQLISTEGRDFQIFIAPLIHAGPKPLYVALSIDLNWVQYELLPQCIAAVGAPRRIRAGLVRAGSAGNADPERAAGEPVSIALSTLLSGWTMQIPTGALQHDESAAQRELLFLGMSAGMFLCILGLGIYLLFRVSRDIHWLQLRNDFVNGVSHELKTPLSLIRLYSETLSDGDEGFSQEERSNYMKIIARESRRLGHLIDNVLSYANIERAQKKQEAQAGDLGSAVLQTLRDYSAYLAEQGFSLETSIPSGLPRVSFDREEIAQVVLNLLDNARKYSGESRRIRIAVWSRDQEVALEVKDFGVGIPAEEKDKIFEPFYQIADGRAKSGSGLGLYLVRHVMDGLGGRIELESTIGRGTKFRLLFPASERGAAEPDEQKARQALEPGWGS